MSVPARTEVLVVGGGPVGLAAALQARRAGREVVVVDRRDGVIDKACGEGLLPGALAAVLDLGVDPPGHPLAGISYRDATRHADHPFAAGPGRGVRRTALHAALRDRALAEGVQIEQATLRGLSQDARGVDVALDTSHGAAHHDDQDAGGPRTLVRASWVLGCDGLHSTVRRLTGLDVPARGRARFGLRTHYRTAPWSDLVEVHWTSHAEAYVTPVAPDVVGVAVLARRGDTGRRPGGDPPAARTDDDGAPAGLAAFAELADRLRDAPVLGRVRGAGPLRQRARRRAAGRVRLVGDASGYVDALTGEGVRVGLAQADAVVRHLDDAATYERAWSRATRDYRVLTTGLLAWAGSPARGAIVPAASAAPWLFGAVVERLAR
ncbi:FAD-dependent oxidoreductase [Cellulosimicrobium protaetiae]|uniref:FAD-dependent oxidoreductase n=1 Tax=Cellulosimicrobium protaetiae TaxID=2587808 RepID=A0A6M5UF07_9MICO|nr:FAD-dependent monooxygenase [Cellulosimicrobium protaetiae]QJW36780.1 FAD-dependent oxidoreductase [Cellulosimicrobium protaetiae]